MWGALAALGFSVVPRLPWEVPLELGYPLVAIDTMPVLYNDRYGYGEYCELMRRSWKNGHVGPAFAAVPGRPAARFVRLGPVILGVYPLGVLGNFGTALALTAIYFRLRSATYRPHSCQSCGYDLTGNVSGRCPECSALVQNTSRNQTHAGGR